ncbi:DNA replication ATP-dependent helicase [Pseudoscourfieldia marina]
MLFDDKKESSSAEIKRCVICFEDESTVRNICSAGHGACAECIPMLVNDYANRVALATSAATTLLRCPGGCNADADLSLIAIAIADSASKDENTPSASSPSSSSTSHSENANAGTTSTMGQLLTAMMSSASRDGESRGRKESIEERRRMILARSRQASAQSSRELVKRIQELMIDRCPGCQVAFDGWDACNVVTCTSCTCKFCGICRTKNVNHAHVVQCSARNDVFDKQGAEIALRERRIRAVRQELDSVTDEKTKQAVIDGVGSILRDLNMREGSKALSSSSGKDGTRGPLTSIHEAETTLRRMLDEMHALERSFKDGSASSFEMIDRPYENVCVEQGDSESPITITCKPYTNESAAEVKQREEELKASLGSKFFAVGACTGNVYKVSRLSSKSIIVDPLLDHRDLVNREERYQPMNTSQPDAVVYVPSMFKAYAGFSREDRAIRCLQTLMEQITGHGNARSSLEAIDDAIAALLCGIDNRQTITDDTLDILSDLQNDGLPLHEGGGLLNRKQMQALDARKARLVQPIWGPPGTGKTTVITTLLRSPICSGLWVEGACERHLTIVCSEKNLAVDAVGAALLKAGGNKPEHPLWVETIAHGAQSSLGSHASQFLVSEKYENSADVQHAKKLLARAQANSGDEHLNLKIALEKIAKMCTTRKTIPITSKKDVERFGKMEEVTEEIHVSLQEAYTADRIREFGHAYFARLALDPNHIKGYRDTDTFSALQLALDKFVAAQEEVDSKERDLDVARHTAKKRLCESARVILVTLGSAHGVEGSLLTSDDDNDVAQIIDEHDGGVKKHRDLSATVICDEASTVHTALFVSALVSTRISITNIVVVGDDRQLAPYWPIQHQGGDTRENTATVLPVSLFSDARRVGSVCETRLTEQYRMPRWLMRLVNICFYSDDPLEYAKADDVISQSADSAEWVHVASSPPTTSPGTNFSRYGGGRGGLGRGGGGRGRGGGRDNLLLRERDLQQNRRARDSSELEAMEIIHIARRERDNGMSVLVITPYRDQRNLLTKQLDANSSEKRKRGERPKSKEAEVAVKSSQILVCTVDGAQGQEADVVIISLVRAFPSRFMNDKRLCVMLSRARRKLIVVGDYDTHVRCRTKPLRELANKSRRVSATTS